MPNPSFLTSPGHFFVGCNYWASHAGTAMWRDWRPDVVTRDLQQLATGGIQALRVFPLWPDFQPLSQLYGGAGQAKELRFGEQPLPDDEYGQAGVSDEMMARFAFFADRAEENGLKLIVGLITGWMSGRLFVPPALEGRNVLKDPAAILWETRLVRCFVRRFRDHPAVAAWDLGNEVNSMASVSREEAWVWTSAITNAIRVEDPTRPVVSGLHGLLPSPNAAWTMQDQGELTDLLTTHPYPYFTPHCDQDPVNTIRTILHSTAESRFYGDIGGKPCLVEEIGTLGPMMASEASAADFIRSALFSAWAHDCHGLMWWCAFDQAHLEHAPYDWHSFERELGLIRLDGSSKPVLGQLAEFARWLKTLPFAALPPRKTEAVCILTEETDSWGIAYATFILAKQAGLDLVFQHASQPLRAARLYLLPSLRGGGSISRRLSVELLRRVKEDGALLYVSHDDCLLSPFNEPFGLEVQTREKRSQAIEFATPVQEMRFSCAAPFKLSLRAAHAAVLAAEPDGNPAWTRADYGKGQIYFLTAPIERFLTETPGSFHGPSAQPFWLIYRAMAAPLIAERLADKGNPLVGISEHALESGERVIVLVNYSPEAQTTTLSLAGGWQISNLLYGQAPLGAQGWMEVLIPKNDALVFLISKR